MFVPLRATDTIITIPLLVIWLIAGYTTIRPGLVNPISRKRLRSGARRSLLWLGLSELLVVVKMGTLALQWAFFGWIFVEDRVLLEVPLLLLPALVVLIFSLPRVRKIAQHLTGKDDGQATPFERQDTTAPALVVPVQVAVIGAAIGTYLVQLYNDPIISLLLIVVFILICPLLWFWQSRRHHVAAMPEINSRRRGLLRTIPALGTILLAPPVWFLGSTQASRLPGRIAMMNHQGGDHQHQQGQQKMVSVTELTGPRTGEPDQRFTLTAQEAQIRLSSGLTVAAWTFNGQLPGPQLRVRQGDLVEVTLINKLSSANATIHWHGLDVPNAEDGVAGVTQDAVRPEQSYTYRFIAKDKPGTYWYHSHQSSSVQVEKGLFGTLIILPRETTPAKEDIMIAAHTWKTMEKGSEIAFGTADTLKRQAIKPGTPVRLRLLNTDNTPMTFVLSGTTFKVAAIDASDVNAPTELSNTHLLVASGGRCDLTFTMPETPVHLSIPKKGSEKGLLLSHDGSGEIPKMANGPLFNTATYGKPQTTPFGPSSHFDREFMLVLDGTIGFYDGTLGNVWPINGKIFPNTPMLMVREGELVKTTFVNRSYMDHPMHLHGHHMLVLSRNGQPVTGSPWWVDTLNVAPGEIYETAFRADNPGVWMDHCHNLSHAIAGMVLHLGYEGVMTPFATGRDTGNTPE